MLQRDDHRCTVGLSGCYVVADQVDHVVQVADGGSNEKSNLRTVCNACHRKLTARNGSRAGVGQAAPPPPAARPTPPPALPRTIYVS